MKAHTNNWKKQLANGTPSERAEILAFLKERVTKDQIANDILARQILDDTIMRGDEIPDSAAREAFRDVLESGIKELQKTLGWSCLEMDSQRMFETELPSEPTHTGLKRNRILILEDEGMLRASMVKGLSKIIDPDLIFDCSLLADAHEELQLRGREYGLALVDFKLPDGNGYDLLATCDEYGISFCAVTAYFESMPTPMPCLNLRKPVSLQSLRDFVSEKMGLK